MLTSPALPRAKGNIAPEDSGSGLAPTKQALQPLPAALHSGQQHSSHKPHEASWAGQPPHECPLGGHSGNLNPTFYFILKTTALLLTVNPKPFSKREVSRQSMAQAEKRLDLDLTSQFSLRSVPYDPSVHVGPVLGGNPSCFCTSGLHLSKASSGER